MPSSTACRCGSCSRNTTGGKRPAPPGPKTWSTRALNFEQPHLDLGGWALTRLPPGPLPCDNGNLECPYGAYLWPFYLTHRGGTDPTEVGQLWAASAQQAPLRSMTDRGDWADRWKEFALWNWNEGPADKYRDNGGTHRPAEAERLGRRLHPHPAHRPAPAAALADQPATAARSLWRTGPTR